MYRGRLPLCVLLCVSLPTPQLLADQRASASNSPEPLQILSDCIQAIQSRDFARYVDHLSDTEQELQAGYALFVANMMAQSAEVGAEAMDPDTILLGRALKDVVKEHTLSETSEGETFRSAAQARDQLISQLYTAAFGGFEGAPTSYNMITPMSEREMYRKSSGVLKDHRQFLIAVLNEASRPTIVSGDKPKTSKPTFDFGEYAKGFSEVKWTIYTRGPYAIAVAAGSEEKGQPQTSAPGGLQPVPTQGDSAIMPLNVGFRRIGGVWKIDRLLPVSARRPQPTSAVAPS